MYKSDLETSLYIIPNLLLSHVHCVTMFWANGFKCYFIINPDC